MPGANEAFSRVRTDAQLKVQSSQAVLVREFGCGPLAAPALAEAAVS